MAATLSATKRVYTAQDTSHAAEPSKLSVVPRCAAALTRSPEGANAALERASAHENAFTTAKIVAITANADATKIALRSSGVANALRRGGGRVRGGRRAACARPPHPETGQHTCAAEESSCGSVGCAVRAHAATHAGSRAARCRSHALVVELARRGHGAAAQEEGAEGELGAGEHARVYPGQGRAHLK